MESSPAVVNPVGDGLTEHVTELRVLIQGLSDDMPIVGPDFDWALLCRLAVAHRVAPLLHSALSRFPHSVPDELSSDLAILRRQSQKQTLLGLRQRDEVLQMLTAAGVPALVVKGPAWARRWYGDVSLRPFGDIDLLLPISDIKPARQMLLGTGYKDWEHPPWVPHHDVPLSHPNQPCSIELHRHLLVLPARETWSFEEVYPRSICLNGRDSLVRTLDPEDTLLHACMHVLQHIKSEPGWRLLNVWDIAKHVEISHVDWQLFEERARALGVDAACHSVLGLVALLTTASIPEAYVDEAGGLYLMEFPINRYSLSPIYHRRILHLLEAISRRDIGMVCSLLVQAISLRRKTDIQDVDGIHWQDIPTESDASDVPLRSLPREILWLAGEGLRSRRGYIREGIRQIRWEEEANDAVFVLLSGSKEQDVESATSDFKDKAWSGTP